MRKFRKILKLSRDNFYGYLFISPWLIGGFLCLTIYPMLSAFWHSFTRYNIIRPAQWVGLENYQRLMGDPLFWKSLYNTAFFTFLGIPLWLVIAFALALLLHQKLKGMGIYRTIFYMPTIVPGVAVAVLWIQLLHPNFGLINALLAMIGISGPSWLTSEAWAKPAIILLRCWAGVGGSMIIFLAQLRSLPEHLYEAAKIDGASNWQQLIRITIPLMTPTIYFNLLVSLIGSFQVFTEAYIMTEGGPVNATTFYVYYFFQQAFNYFNMGYASAMTVIMFIIILVVTIFINRSSGRWVHYN